MMKDANKVRGYIKEICRVEGLEFKEEYVNDDYFLGRFTGQQRNYLNTLGLINPGFCPLCGEEPITNQYYRGMANTTAVQYLCKECYEKTNPHLTIPGYTRRYYTAKIVMWTIGIGILIGIFFLLRSCFRFGLP